MKIHYSLYSVIRSTGPISTSYAMFRPHLRIFSTCYLRFLLTQTSLSFLPGRLACYKCQYRTDIEIWMDNFAIKLWRNVMKINLNARITITPIKTTPKYLERVKIQPRRVKIWRKTKILRGATFGAVKSLNVTEDLLSVIFLSWSS
jgi:hypothetical protein